MVNEPALKDKIKMDPRRQVQKNYLMEDLDHDFDIDFDLTP